MQQGVSRRSMPFVVAGLAALVALLSTGNASATSPIEVTKADGSTHCPTFAAGGCKTHIQGESTLFLHVFGFEGVEATCNMEWRGAMDEDGVGQVTGLTVTPGKHDADCSAATAPPCSGSLPFNMAAEKDVDGVVRAHYDVCMDYAENAPCSGEFLMSLTETGSPVEVQTQSANDLRIGSSSMCELTRSLTSEVVAPDGEEIHVKSI